MLHEEIYKRFIKIFPQYESEAVKYTAKGKNTIFIQLHNNATLIFIYNPSKTWKLYSYASQRRALVDFHTNRL